MRHVRIDVVGERVKKVIHVTGIRVIEGNQEIWEGGAVEVACLAICTTGETQQKGIVIENPL